jgi:hypothetical protein
MGNIVLHQPFAEPLPLLVDSSFGVCTDWEVGHENVQAGAYRPNFQPGSIVLQGFFPKPDPVMLAGAAEQVLRSLVDEVPAEVGEAK